MVEEDKLEQLREQIDGFITKLDELNPKETSVEDIDQLIMVIEEMEEKLK